MTMQELEQLPFFIEAGSVIERRYRIVKLAGIGGMGWVVSAQDLSAGEELVALKILYPHLVDSQRALQRLRREALVTMKMSHPNIVQTYSVGSVGEISLYLAMEYVEGEKILSKIGALPLEKKINIFYSIAQALQFAHRAGVIHRDLKPDNILLSTLGDVKIADFGLASILKKTEEITQIGEILGTPLYMSPEQFRGELLDERSDIYSYGIMLYEFLSGVAPFEAKSFLALADQHCEKELPLDRLFNVPEKLQQLVARCCHKEKEDRFQSVQEIILSLEELSGVVKDGFSGRVSIVPDVNSDRSLVESKFWKGVQYISLSALTLGIVICIVAVSTVIRTTNYPRAKIAGKLLEAEEHLDYRFNLLRAFFQVEIPNADKRYLFFRANDMDHAVYSAILPAVFATKDLNFRFRGISPLQYWSYYTETKYQRLVLEEMLKNGADINYRDARGRVAAEFAISVGGEEAIKLFLDHGLDPNFVTTNGQTLLNLSIIAGQARIAQILVENGAKILKEDSNGINAIELAKQENNQSLLRLFESLESE